MAGLTKHEQERLERLEERTDWLEARVAIAEAQGKDRSFDKAELSALKWVIRFVMEHAGGAECRKGREI